MVDRLVYPDIFRCAANDDDDNDHDDDKDDRSSCLFITFCMG